MKKALILILISLVFNSIAQQSLTLSFEARHYQGQNVGLDSILIKNITRNCDTMLYAPDTVLYYNFFVGIDDKIKNESSFISSVYPNPAVNNNSYFNINVNKHGKLKLEVFDIMGRSLFKSTKTIFPGNYKYQLSMGSGKYYILKATFNNEHKSFKILNIAEQNNTTCNVKLISEHQINTQKTSTSGGFWFEPGDTLWYVGYAQTPYGIAGSDVLEGVPAFNEHRRFIIVEGLPCEDVVAVKYSGNLYPTVSIYGNCWFKENLNTGTMINGYIDMTDNGIIEKYCYDNNPDNCDEYGALYQWYELMNYEENEATQGICPQGWHIPTSDEYFSLVEDIDGLACKERGNDHWLPGFNVGGNNNKGFTALGSGYRQNTTLFEKLNQSTVFHSSTKLTNNYVWYLELNKNNYILYGTSLKISGLSIRCVKD